MSDAQNAARTDDLKYLRMDDLPEDLYLELCDAARSAGNMSVSSAMAAVLCGADLRRSILQGQLNLGAFDGSECRSRGVFLPVDVKSALKDAAKQAGVKLGSAGRLVLMGKAGSITAALQDGLRVQVDDPVQVDG